MSAILIAHFSRPVKHRLLTLVAVLSVFFLSFLLSGRAAADAATATNRENSMRDELAALAELHRNFYRFKIAADGEAVKHDDDVSGKGTGVS